VSSSSPLNWSHRVPHPRLASRFLVMRSPDILIFMRTASEIASCMYNTGLDPLTGEEVCVSKHLRDRKVERALLQSTKRRPR
jgi:hypothetical protein